MSRMTIWSRIRISENKVVSLEDAQNCKVEQPVTTVKSRKKLDSEREYSKEDIAGLFTSLEEVEI